MVTDLEQNILDLLSDNWNSSNTSSITPDFIRITDISKKRYHSSREAILIMTHPPRKNVQAMGIGGQNKLIEWKVTLDLRVSGSTNRGFFLEAIEEVERIIDTNIRNPFTDFQELEFSTDDLQELSDKNKGLWRITMPIVATQRNKVRASVFVQLQDSQSVDLEDSSGVLLEVR